MTTDWLAPTCDAVLSFRVGSANLSSARGGAGRPRKGQDRLLSSLRGRRWKLGGRAGTWGSVFECLILVPLRPTHYDRISGDSSVVHGPAQRSPQAVPKGPNPTPAEHNTEHCYIGSRDGTGAAALPFARWVGTEGGEGRPRWGDLPMRGNTGCFCPLVSVGAVSAAWVVIGAGAGVGSGG